MDTKDWDFEKEDFHVTEWINAQIADENKRRTEAAAVAAAASGDATPAKPKKRGGDDVLSMLLMKLQIMNQDLASSLDAASADLMRSVPRYVSTKQATICCVVLCCGVLCCVVLYCVVLCCVVLCCLPLTFYPHSLSLPHFLPLLFIYNTHTHRPTPLPLSLHFICTEFYVKSKMFMLRPFNCVALSLKFVRVLLMWTKPINRVYTSYQISILFSTDWMYVAQHYRK
jgi:hypothetical protein